VVTDAVPPDDVLQRFPRLGEIVEVARSED